MPAFQSLKCYVVLAVKIRVEGSQALLLPASYSLFKWPSIAPILFLSPEISLFHEIQDFCFENTRFTLFNPTTTRSRVMVSWCHDKKSRFLMAQASP